MSTQTSYSTDRGSVVDDRDYVHRTSTETRKAFRTTELWVFIAASVAVMVSAYTDDAFNIEHGWTLVAVMAAAYMLARGIAKAGSHEPREDKVAR